MLAGDKKKTGGPGRIAENRYCQSTRTIRKRKTVEAYNHDCSAEKQDSTTKFSSASSVV